MVGVRSLFLFGEHLVRKGIINREQLGHALYEQIHGEYSGRPGAPRGKIGEVLVGLGYLSPDDLREHLIQLGEDPL